MRSPLPNKQPSTVGAGHDELGGRHGGAPVVVRVHAQDDGVAPRQVAVHPLDLIGVDVGRRALDRGGQVDDRGTRRGRPQVSATASQNLLGEVELGGAERLGRVLEAPVGAGVGRGQGSNLSRGPRCDLQDPGAVLLKNHPAEQGRGRVVDVDTARRAPPSEAKVRSIGSGRACVSTWMTTSSGIRPSSIKRRTKSNSTWEADGNPTSISLNPMRTSVSNMRSLRG